MRAVFAIVFGLLLFACSTASSEALPTETITIETRHGPRQFKVEIAADSQSQARGLMFRKDMDPDAGMIFVLDSVQFTSFWMENTFLPLDMLFVRADGTISTIAANAVPLSETSIPSAEPVKAVIEINGGRARALDIVPGDKVLSPEFAAPAAHN